MLKSCCGFANGENAACVAALVESIRGLLGPFSASLKSSGSVGMHAERGTAATPRETCGCPISAFVNEDLSQRGHHNPPVGPTTLLEHKRPCLDFSRPSAKRKGKPSRQRCSNMGGIATSDRMASGLTPSLE